MGAVLLAGLATAGAATATQADAQPADQRINGTDGDNGTDVGICMIGVDSPCNGEQWDGDNETTDDSGASDSETNHADRIGDSDDAGDDDAGICLVGAGGPCNGEDSSSNSSNLTPVTDTGDTRRIEPGQKDDGSAGICMVGAGGPCNGDTQTSDDRRIGADSGHDHGDAGICLVGADSACNSDSEPSVSIESAPMQRQSTLDFFVGLFSVLF